MRAGQRIRLDSLPACREELERCSNGFAQLTQAYTALREDLAKVQEYLTLVWALTLIGTEGANQAEREAKVTAALYEHPDTRELVELEAEYQSDLEVLKKRLSNLEVRGSHAQSAIKAHEQEARFAQ